MIEARVFVDSLDNIKAILEREKAECKGRYTIHDTIYRNINSSIPLMEEFLRLRVIPENIWDEKAVILALKQTKLCRIGKNSHIPLKLQFDKQEDAEDYYEKNLKHLYVKDFAFWRIGWQYVLPNGDGVDLETIKGTHHSIELKSEFDSGMEKLLQKFAIRSEDVITGPSVAAVKNILQS